jgi:hypothetical protein
MTEAQPRRKSLNDVRAIDIPSVFDLHPDSVGSAKQSLVLEPRLHDDQWTSVSSLLPVLPVPANECQKRRNTICTLTSNSNEDADLARSEMEQMKKALREARWAPISPMRPIVPILLKDSQLVDALPLIEDAGIRSDRWAASAHNEMTASGHGQRSAQHLSVDEDLSVDSFGLIMEDDDDNEARVAAHQIALEHSRNERSIARSQVVNETTGTCRLFDEKEDECARMIGRKTALEHLIAQHMETLSQLKDELSQVESRLHILGSETPTTRTASKFR